MKIKRIFYVIHKEFSAVFVCEKCNHEQEGEGFDTSFFRENILPDMKCNECGESTIKKDYFCPNCDLKIENFKKIKTKWNVKHGICPRCGYLFNLK